MPVIAEPRRKAIRALTRPLPLENGDRLTSGEFLRRYEAMPELKKAELIEGVVYMPSPVSADHSEPDGILHGWLLAYAAATSGVKFFPNATVILGPRDTAQPDACLCLKPGRGGQVRFNEKQYLVGAPELVAEVAASSASLDLGDKMEAYARAGVREYLVWRTREPGFDWFALEDAEYLPVAPDARGVFRSRVFPGLVLDVKALLALDAGRVLAGLRRGLVSAGHKAFVARAN